MKRHFAIVFLLGMLSLRLWGQVDSIPVAAEAAEFDLLALKGLQADKTTYFEPMKPTIEDCRAVFKGNAAELVYHFCKGGMNKSDPDLMAAFVDFKTAHFTTAQLKVEPAFLGSQQREMRDYLLPNHVFYQISYLESDATPFYLRYFVKLNGRWVFFSNAWKAFVTQD